MTAFQRIENFIIGLGMIVIAVLLAWSPEDGFIVIATILSVSMTAMGVRYLYYYATMARHMVGGKAVLYLGVIVLDFGVYSMTLIDEPRIYIVVDLIAVHTFWGIVNLLKGFREKGYGASMWKLDVGQGIGNLMMAAASLIFLHSPHILVDLYSAGLAYSGILKVISALRRTEIVYIQ